MYAGTDHSLPVKLVADCWVVIGLKRANQFWHSQSNVIGSNVEIRFDQDLGFKNHQESV